MKNHSSLALLFYLLVSISTLSSSFISAENEDQQNQNEIQNVATRPRPSAAPATKFPTLKPKTAFPTFTPQTENPTWAPYDFYEPGTWPTPAPHSWSWNWPSSSPVTPNPTTPYPTTSPTIIKAEAYEINFVGITYQEHMSVVPNKVLNVSITVNENLIPKAYLNMPGFNIMNADTLSKDGWDVATFKLTQLSYDSVKKIRTYGTLTGILAPGSIGLHEFRWSNEVIESPTFIIEVTCSDGIKCNGDERYVYYKDPLTKALKAKCQKASKKLCDDGNDCTTDTCNEETGRCTFKRDLSLPSKKCPPCNGGNCIPNCSKRKCGPDSCGGSCGPDCTGTDEYCVVGKCQVLTGEKGVCGKPHELTKDFATKRFKGIFDYAGNTAKGFSILRTYCNFESEAKELIYMFKTPRNSDYIGVDIRVVPAIGSGLYSPVIQLIEVDPAHFPNPADGCNAVNKRRDLVAGCNNFSTPPGNGGSRVTWALKPGYYYYIQVESYWSDDEGRFNMTVALTPGCTMKCDNKICGDSGCGSDFPCQLNKPLSPNTICEENLEGSRLISKKCKPDCKKKQCGDDGCGGTCGECDFSKGDVCSSTINKCVPLGKCDHFKPRCTYQEKINGQKVTVDGCPENSFCGVDCICYDVDKFVDLPDLYISDSMMSETSIVDDYDVSPGDCAYDEGCINALGKRRLFRFPTLVANQGRKDFSAASPPESRPDIYVWGECHGHFHFDGFAEFSLLSSDRKKVVVEGGKRSFCAEDSTQLMEFPSAPCLPTHDCSTQGVSIGWTDIYSKALDCQFLDITGVTPGNYVLKQCTNIKRTYEELSRGNNCMYYPVRIPDESETRTNAPTYD